MYDAFAEATKAITWAISSGAARRLTGTVETSAALFSSVLVKRVSIPVSAVPRGHHINAHTGARDFKCSGLCQPFHGMFAGYVNGRASGTDASIRRRDVNDAPGPLRQHRAQFVLHA